jgi:hypothetical protein
VDLVEDKPVHGERIEDLPHPSDVVPVGVRQEHHVHGRRVVVLFQRGHNLVPVGLPAGIDHDVRHRTVVGAGETSRHGRSVRFVADGDHVKLIHVQ